MRKLSLADVEQQIMRKGVGRFLADLIDPDTLETIADEELARAVRKASEACLELEELLKKYETQPRDTSDDTTKEGDPVVDEELFDNASEPATAGPLATFPRWLGPDGKTEG